MFRALSTTSGSSLLRCPASISCIRRSYRVASSKPKTPTTVRKSPRKTLNSSSGIDKAIGVEDGKAETVKGKRTGRRTKAGSATDSTAAAPAEKDGEHSTIKVGKVRKRISSKRADIDIDQLGANSRDERTIQEYLNLIYKSRRNARSRLFDHKRVHIVSKSLCDDTLERLKPSLEKHVGCDIIDLNPGPGIWSSALHEFLKPRTHILMEPDARVYGSILKPLVDTEGSRYRLIAKSGLIWDSLHEILTPEYLPHQESFERSDPRLEQPNNTLLLVANLGFNPQKPFRGFPSVTSLVLYQFLSAARSHSLFHKYGHIRMLLWVDENAKNVVLPKNVSSRKKAAVEAELTCSDIDEVVSTPRSSSSVLLRDSVLELESTAEALKRMKEAGITTPIARRGQAELEASEDLSEAHDSKISFQHKSLAELEDLERRFAAGEFPMFVDTPEGRLAADKFENRGRGKSFVTPEWTKLSRLRREARAMENRGETFRRAEELRKLEESHAAGEFHMFKVGEIKGYDGYGRLPVIVNYTPEFLRLWKLRKQHKQVKKTGTEVDEIVREFDEIQAMRKQATSLEGSAAEELELEIDERYNAFMEKIATTDFRHGLDGQVSYTIDNRVALRQDPPLLYWDRRKAEPLKADTEEFYPESKMALLDLQPRPLFPILRKNYPENYDVLEYILSTLLTSSRQSVRDGFHSLAPGAFEWLVAECPSITNIKKGGSTRLDVMTVRCLTLDMYKEIVEAWIKWPFRPTRTEILSRMGSDIYDPDAAEDS